MHIARQNETKVALATLILLIYTVSLSVASSVVKSAQNKRKILNTVSIITLGVGIYEDADCTRAISGIDWGTLEPGSNKSVVIYIRNEGSSSASLMMHTSNWNPSDALNYVVLSWDREGCPIKVREAVEATFTLSVSANITGITTFSFDINLMAST